MTDTLDYAAMQMLIEHQDWWFTPAEAHGMLTALVAGNHADDWQILLFPGTNIDDTAKKTMRALIAHIDQALAKNDLRFQLMLPEDATPSERAEALTFWVQGFKIAITSLRERNLIKLDKDCLEFIADLDAFAELDTQLPDNDENLLLLAELEEHCRMGALMLYAYVRIPKQSAE